MKYELIDTTIDNVKIYARIEDDGKCYITCSEYNPDYQAWAAEQDAEAL